jgi:hypothetical protein
MQKLGLQNEEIKHNCIIHQQNLIGKALRRNQVMADLFSTLNFISSLCRNFRLFEPFLDATQSEYGDIIWLLRSSLA